MPEIEPLWETLVEAAGADRDAARFLTFWNPPRYLANCSQAVLVDQDGPFLIRNYDLDPALNESTLLSTAWRGRRVTGMVEGMAGLADGMNDAGLAVSLTFGGRPVHGSGFGVPLILRYLLEISADVRDAVELLRRVPCHMSYNVTLLDRSGKWATVFLAPDRPAMVTEQPYATNHQLGVEWPHHGRVSNTLKREAHLKALLSSGGLTAADLASEFQAAPLFSTGYAEGFGTVYTSAYRPETGEISLSWRDGSPVTWHIDQVEDRDLRVVFSASGSSLRETPKPEAGEIPDRTCFGRADPIDADRLSRFFEGLSRNLAVPAEADWIRLAAIWQRNHRRSVGGWCNLNEVTFDPATARETT